MTIEVTNEFKLPTDQKEVENLRKSLEEIVNVMVMIDAKKEFIKDEINALSMKYKIPKKYLRRVANTLYKQTFEKEKIENDDFISLYASIFGGNDDVCT